MKSTIKEITPQWASKVLETRNPHNRNVSEPYVKKLARDIQCGSYLLTHQAIAFDTNGDLIDGQHRLHAVVLAQKPVKMLVVSGVEPTAKLNGSSIHTFSVIDSGRARRVGQMLQMEGYKYATRIAATARVLAQMCMGSHEFLSISVAMAKRILCASGGSIEQCSGIAAGGKIFKSNTAATAAVAFWHNAQPHEAEAFLVELVDVTGRADSSTRKLASWVSKHPQSGGQCAFYHFQATANAIRQHVTGQSTGRIYCNQESVDWLFNQNPNLQKKIAAIVPTYEDKAAQTN